ncbi:MAG: efflux RND transporter periplasmic adaptor subunit [Planctomycetes bacterium]|nr:efflux RND transporter periplasmic adaptor subunit [Planctomycetota bacterium]
MRFRFRFPGSRQGRAIVAAASLLVTVAVTWLFAHEGHAPLPTRGVQVDTAKGTVVLMPDARKVLDLDADIVKPRVVNEKLLAYATLVAPWQKHAFASTRLPGRIVKINVKPGEFVPAKHVLAEVQSLELEDLQLEILNNQTAIELSDQVVEEMKPLAKQGAIADRDYREALSKQEQNKNAQKIAHAKWLSLGLGADKYKQLLATKTRVVATMPIVSVTGGTVIHADVAEGRVVEPTEHLFEIIDLSSVWVKIGVLERDLHRVQVGQVVELRFAAYPDEVTSAAVQIKSLYLDPATHLATVWAELKNDAKMPRFLPGMHGQAHIVLAPPGDVLTVPSDAVASDGVERYVLVETVAPDKQGKKPTEYKKVHITTGLHNGEWTQVTGGDLFGQDRVVTKGLHQLSSFFMAGILRLSPEAAKNFGVAVETVERRAVEEVLELQGTVDVPPDRRSFASGQLPGKIQRIAIERNQEIKKGEIVAEVASLELQKLQLDLLQAHLQLGLLKETLDRLAKVETIVSRKQLWEAKSSYNEVVNRRESLKRKLEAVGLEERQIKGILEKTELVDALPIRAPRDGVVVRFDKALGQVIKADEPLFEIHDLSQVYVQGFLSEKDVPAVRVGQKVRVRLVADPGFLGEGKVARSGQVVGQDSRVLSFWVELDKQPAQRLEHNLLARVSVSVGKSEATLAVPLGALVNEGTRSYVFVRRFQLIGTSVDALEKNGFPGKAVEKLSELASKSFATEEKLRSAFDQTLAASELRQGLSAEEVESLDKAMEDATHRERLVREAVRSPVFERRLVEVGRRADDRFAEIVAGLVSGESVAVKGTRALQTAYAGIR